MNLKCKPPTVRQNQVKNHNQVMRRLQQMPYFSSLIKKKMMLERLKTK